MVEVLVYRAGETLPADIDYLVINRISRARGWEYYVGASPSLASRTDLRLPTGPAGYASRETALDEARKAAEAHGLRAIYMELASL